MKIMIASDIHGSAYYLKMLLDRFRDYNPDRLLLLGDILYHGPRNDLPKGYSPKEVIDMLNPLADRLLCVRGNCDAEVDQMVLKFPVLADYAFIPTESADIFCTHGHIYGEDNPPPLKRGDILLCGHTHIPKYSNCGSFRYVNPGSVSIPKENSPHSYITLSGGVLSWRDIESGNEYRRELI